MNNDNTSLIKRIQEDVKDAMRSKDSLRLSTLRMLTAAIKQREVDTRAALDDTQIITVVEKSIKQRKESISQFQAANRADLVERETAEMEILQKYLPQQMSSEEIETAITSSVKEVNAASIKDLGKVIAALKPKIQGRADMGQISSRVKFILENM